MVVLGKAAMSKQKLKMQNGKGKKKILTNKDDFFVLCRKSDLHPYNLSTNHFKLKKVNVSVG